MLFLRVEMASGVSSASPCASCRAASSASRASRSPSSLSARPSSVLPHADRATAVAADTTMRRIVWFIFLSPLGIPVFDPRRFSATSRWPTPLEFVSWICSAPEMTQAEVQARRWNLTCVPASRARSTGARTRVPTPGGHGRRTSMHRRGHTHQSPHRPVATIAGRGSRGCFLNRDGSVSDLMIII